MRSQLRYNSSQVRFTSPDSQQTLSHDPTFTNEQALGDMGSERERQTETVGPV